MAIFGDQNAYGSNLNVHDNIYGSHFTCPSAGEAQSITAYLHSLAGSGDYKCAIYNHGAPDDKVLVGVTEEKSISPSTEWVEFAFVSKPDLINRDYFLVVWSDDEAGQCRYSYEGAGKGNDAVDSHTYNNYPNPWDPTIQDSSFISIYCTYEEPPPAVKAIVQATLISIPPLIVLPTLSQILKLTGGC